MKIENLEAFVRIAELKSFTLAADACFCTQATMSQRLKNLENYFKIQLFDRVGRNIELTEEGRRVLPYCQSALNAIAQSRVELESINGLASGELKLCSSNTPGTYLLPQIIADFHRRHPGVSIESCIRYARDVIQDISFEGEAELGIVSQPELPENKKLDFEAILHDELQVIVAPGHPKTDKWREKGAIALSELQKQTLMVSNAKSSIAANLERASGKRVSFAALLVMGSMEAVKKAVMLNSGVAIVSKLLVEHEVASGQLLAFDIKNLPLSRTVYLVTRKNRSLSPAAKAFVEVLKEDIASKYPDLLVD